MRVSVFGLGYVGCVTAACLARAGHAVVGVDPNGEKVALVNAGRPPVVEPGLGELLGEVVPARRLRATTSAREGIDGSDAALICVGTPGAANGRIDLASIERVGRDIGASLRGREGPFTVVLRSTVLPGTTEERLLPALREGTGDGPGFTLRVAVNPEFMREGSSLRDFQEPPLTLVGCGDASTAGVLRELYAGVAAPFVQAPIRVVELVKYASNAFHALKVCFANEIGDLCQAFDIDSREVMRIFLQDRRLNVSEAYLRPGFAFGGSCLPKDLRALLYAARRADLSVPLLSAILPSNDLQVSKAAEAVLATRRRRVGLVGLSFKPGTDDLRESPLVRLAETLIGKGCDLRVLDRSVAIARLTGANRRYIEEEIPHIASLMCDHLDDFLGHSEVVVIGRGGDEARRVMERIASDRIRIDLTRGGLGAGERAAAPAAPMEPPSTAAEAHA